MKNNEYKQKFLEALCDQREVTVDALKLEYEAFQKRLNQNRGG